MIQEAAACHLSQTEPMPLYAAEVIVFWGLDINIGPQLVFIANGLEAHEKKK